MIPFYDVSSTLFRLGSSSIVSTSVHQEGNTGLKGTLDVTTGEGTSRSTDTKVLSYDQVFEKVGEPFVNRSGTTLGTYHDPLS